MDLYTHQNVDNKEERKDDAIRQIKAGTSLLLDIIKTTLGPKGALKILQGRETSITNDGAFILKNLQIDNPGARILVSSSIAQDHDEGDGTTSIAVLTSLLLQEAYKSSVHPIKLISGFSMAVNKCLEILNKKKFVPKAEDIKNLVRTTINSKVISSDIELFTEICMKAVNNAEDIELIEILKMEGELRESMFIDGFVMQADVTLDIENPRILVCNTSLDYDKLKVLSSKIKVNTVSELKEIEDAEKEKMKNKIELLTSVEHDLLVNRQLVYDYPMQLLKNKGVKVIENANFDGVERLNKVVGGNLLSYFEGMSAADLGKCDRVRNIELKGHKMIKFEGVKKGACTIVLFGGSDEILKEAERSVHDALCVLKRIKESPLCLYGGGSVEMALALELFKYAMEIKTKEAEGVECFARALQQIPAIICENCGFDGDEVKALLKNDHSYRRTNHGVNIENGKTCCMRDKGIIEGYEMKKRVITAGCETAQTILKCDGFVKIKPRERTSDANRCC